MGRARRSSRKSRPSPWRVGGVDLDEFYRRALTQGLEYHHAQGRGLEQEIRALDHPPLPWDARPARWFDEHVRVDLRAAAVRAPRAGLSRGMTHAELSPG